MGDLSDIYGVVIRCFYDSGAQVSMIRNSVAESMGLTGKRIKIYLTKVGGLEEELDTMLYVYAIYEKLKVPGNDLKRRAGPIDILIGINYPNFHVGETKVKDGFVARKGPLGWVIFGVDDSTTENPQQVLHVRLAGPVDITEFWKTESMGVSIQPCTCKADEMSNEEKKELKVIEQSCELKGNQWQMSYPWKKDASLLPNNYDQVLKKLESTEQRLLKNPEHAQSYDRQIQELEELGFAKKVKKEELKSYDGPVHYVAHHAVVRPEKKSTPVRIVFNSSATYKGHTLNDYWYKGPDLLNNLLVLY